MRRDRRLAGGERLSDLRRQGVSVHLRGLFFPVWVVWYRYPLPRGGWEGRYVVATFPATARTALTWGRRFTLEHFFRAAKGEFSLGQFGQRTPLGAHRFLVLSLLAYLLVCWPTGCGWAYLARGGPYGGAGFDTPILTTDRDWL